MNFFMPVKLYTGDGCMAKEQALFQALGKRCLLVTGQHAAEKSGALNDVKELLQQGNIEFFIFNDIHQNPSVESCIRAVTISTRIPLLNPVYGQAKPPGITARILS